MVGLQVVTYAMQIAFARTADSLPAGVVFTVGTHFEGVLIGLWGFIMAATAFACAFGVFASGVLPHGAVLSGGRLLRLGAGRHDRAVVPGHLDSDAADPNY
jgi:hypothetical protein